MLVSPSSHECLTRGKSNSENVIILFAGFGDVIFILHILENFSILLNVFWDEFDWNDILLDSLLNSCLSQSLELEYLNQLSLVTPPASDHRYTQPPTSPSASLHTLYPPSPPDSNSPVKLLQLLPTMSCLNATHQQRIIINPQTPTVTLVFPIVYSVHHCLNSKEVAAHWCRLYYCSFWL